MTRLLLAALLLAGCNTTLRTGLTEAQANQIVVALDQSMIAARKREARGAAPGPTYSVEVPDGDLAQALSLLAAAGLPTEAKPGFAEIYGKPAIVPTLAEEEARKLAAETGELATSIEALDAVLDARVHIAQPDPTKLQLDESAPPRTASVLVVHEEGATPDESAIRNLVAGGLHALDPANVHIVTRPNRVPQSAARNLVWLGPVAVTRATAPTAKAIIAAGLGAAILLSSGLLVSVRRRRRAR